MSQNDTTQVKSLARGLNMLKALAAHPHGLALADLARAVELAPSTTHRLLDTLVQQRFVRQSSDGLWQVGMTCFEVGTAFFVARDWVRDLYPALVELSERGNETANMGTLDGDEVIFVGQVECREVMRMVAPLGSRAPAYASGVGKALLASRESASILRHLPQPMPAAFTATTLDSTDAVLADMQAIRERGYAIDWEERNPGLRCVAAPVFDEHGAAQVAISLSGPATRMDEARVHELGRWVAATAYQRTLELGGHWPDAWARPSEARAGTAS
ncbi:helix-turn-helix domain-containing protein [Litorivicinus lipolyticus]|uniref:HTH-type transcriptional repressor AllR n=1 Tax=Litorivicinus lipolyticus TaxID=418701 RepID=A0A5Q2Q851_9GAMM|nr:IclR family transcriptional regulator [Litorivicinus lipolyticus]QGG80779.1 helix-turn-helix domain-containing protein [Litorivicinus lipolyticus]